MDENLHNIEDLFRDGLDNNEETPPIQAWKDIDNILNRDNIVSIEKKYSYLKRVAFILLVLLLGLSIYELSNWHNNEPGSIYTNKSQNPVDSKSLSNVNRENESVDNLSADKNASNNNLQLQPESNNIIGNITTSDNNISASSKKKDNYNQNIIIDSISVSKNKQRFSDKALIKVKVSSPGPTKDDPQTTVNDNTTVTNLQSRLLMQLIPVAIDKIKSNMQNPVEANKSSQTIAANKITLPLNTINTPTSNTKKKEGRSSRFSITPFFSPDMAWYRLQQDKPDNQPDNAIKIEKGERHEFSSTTGLLVDYGLNKYFTLQTGLIFSNINITINPKTIYAQPDNNGNVKYRLNISSGYGYLLPSFQNTPVIGDSLYISAATHKLRYIGIPVAVKYGFVKGKFSIEAMAGVGVNFLTKGKLETEIKQGPNNEIDVLNKIEGLRSIYLNGLAGISATYKLTDKFSFTLMPTARIALTSINKDGVVKTYPNSAGLSAGLKIKL